MFAFVFIGVLLLLAVVAVAALVNRAKSVQDQARVKANGGKSVAVSKSERPVERVAERRVREPDPNDIYEDREDAGWIVKRLLIFMIFLPIYLLPTGVAIFRRHNNLAPIIIVNVFLGIIFIGWVLALAWSVSDMRPMRTERPS